MITSNSTIILNSIVGPAGPDGAVGPQGPAGAPGPAATIVATTATQTFSVTGLANITQLVTSLAANKIYLLTAPICYVTASTTTGLKLGLTLPAGAVFRGSISIGVTTSDNTTPSNGYFPRGVTPLNTPSVAAVSSSVSGQNLSAMVSGIITTSATTGNLQFQAATNVNAVDVAIQIGSMFTLILLN